MLRFSGSSQNPGSSVLDELQLSNGLLWKAGKGRLNIFGSDWQATKQLLGVRGQLASQFAETQNVVHKLLGFVLEKNAFAGNLPIMHEIISFKGLTLEVVVSITIFPLCLVYHLENESSCLKLFMQVSSF